MTSTTRLLNLLFLGAIAVAAGACANPAVQECGTFGVLCPTGTHCAAAQGICLPDSNTCGNFHVDPGEVCDDGNTIDGDGCSANCLSNEKCGNGTLDKPIKDAGGNVLASDPRNEDCDTPGAIDPTSGLFCSAVCKFEKCGNHVVDKDIGEVCDDGNTVGADGCSANCKSTEICGNGIVDREVGEVCDPPNVGGCSADCRSTGDCGNGIVDTDKGEECDDGIDQAQRHNGDDQDCRSDCVINRCGDGRVNMNGTHKEDCDAGPKTADHLRTAVPTESDTCNIDCTTPKCGDGKVNHSFKPNGADGEQCDNGTGVNDDHADCTASCLLSVCGDHLVNTVGPTHKEICDDGNRIDTDDCTNACFDHSCGDGIVDRAIGEECDLGKDQAGVSKNTDTSACPGCLLARCGDGKTETGVEQCDNSTNTVGSGCSPTCHTERCGNGIIDPNEECDNGAANNDNGDCRKDCILNRCGDGHVNTLGLHTEACDDAIPAPTGDNTLHLTQTPNCDIDCTRPTCGDTIVNRQSVVAAGPPVLTEQCDPPSVANGCSASCQFERCGNGIVDPGEQCDSTPGCSSTCFRQECGNAIVDPGEECDNGDATHGNGNGDNKDCRTDCVINRCGDGFRNDTVRNGHTVEECDGGPRPTTAGDRTAVPTNKSDCNSNCKLPSCGDDFVNPLFVAPAPPTVPANTLPEQCDPPGPGCSAICRLENCGNHVVDPGEQCDDGNSTPGDGCENDCTLPTCGNHITDLSTVPPEECDDGNLSNTDGCTNDCKSARCGDGFVQTGVEECDTTPTLAECTYHRDPFQCDVCDPVTCKLDHPTSAFCGDGNTDVGFEVCDSHNNSCGVCPDCQGKRLSPAVGFISAAPANELNPAGMPHDTFKFSDGFADPVTFEFTRTTGDITSGHIEILLGPDVTTAADVASVIADAIAGQHQFQVTVLQQGSLVMLTDVRKSSLGNNNLSEVVITPSFAVIDMAGGAGADCLLNALCTEDNDCASGHCTNNQCGT